MLKKILLITLLIGLCQFLFLNSSLAFDFNSFSVNSLNPFNYTKPQIGTPESQRAYLKQVAKDNAIEKYERSLMPESGYMTTEEYENLSKDVPSTDKVIPEYKLPKDIKMKYVPQPTYKLARYNDPPGTAELHIGRSLGYDRQFVCPGITSPNKDILVYPVVSFFVVNQCTSCDLFVVPLDKNLADVSRILRANIFKRNPIPILSTDRDITEKFIFRTLTPVDFSSDGTKLVIKEKIGNSNDGIWKTNLWVYDFTTKTAKQLSEIREAIKFYWLSHGSILLDEKRWDIVPLGFDAQNPDRIVVSAYGYTGKTPKFLGNWSVDCKGERAMLLSLFDSRANIAMNGLKIVKSGFLTPADFDKYQKLDDKLKAKKRKEDAKVKQKELKDKKKALNKELKEINKAYSVNPQKEEKEKPELQEKVD